MSEPRYYEVFSVRPGRDRDNFIRMGAMFPNKSGKGYSMVLDALPLQDKEGACRLVIMPPKDKDGTRSGSGGSERREESYGGGGGGATPADLDDDIPF